MMVYVHRYEQLANKPVKFLLFIKKTLIPKKIDPPDKIILSFYEEIETGYIFELLADIKITETGKRQVRNEQMLKQLPHGKLKKYVSVADLIRGVHISFMTPDRIWVNDGRSLILTNSKGNNLHHIFDVSELYGVHTVNSEGELIYVDKDWNINKLSADNTTKSTLIKRTEGWEPWCICHSASTEDLVVMMRYDTRNPTIVLSDVKVIRYNSAVQPIQTIQYHKTGEPLYDEPAYITENRNGDIVVSDRVKGVVVTDREGKYRFTYIRPEGWSFAKFMPCGICVDAFFNILISCVLDCTIHRIKKDGHLLSITATAKDGVFDPLGLGYDEKNYLVLLGSDNKNILSVYRSTERQDYLA
ncbi:uncharacterized protein LOC134258876 [Saccostrea cucullata]|uniref:uncharacterized protein LOC134258876 n=1 Tax=Saccostrea cuccullata TaxID=36930 RepID=UPI002ED62C1E